MLTYKNNSEHCKQHRENSANGGEEAEHRYYLDLGPAAHFKVMMNWAHLEKSLAVS